MERNTYYYRVYYRKTPIKWEYDSSTNDAIYEPESFQNDANWTEWTEGVEWENREVIRAILADNRPDLGNVKQLKIEINGVNSYYTLFESQPFDGGVVGRFALDWKRTFINPILNHQLAKVTTTRYTKAKWTPQLRMTDDKLDSYMQNQFIERTMEVTDIESNATKKFSYLWRKKTTSTEDPRPIPLIMYYFFMDKGILYAAPVMQLGKRKKDVWVEVSYGGKQINTGKTNTTNSEDVLNRIASAKLTSSFIGKFFWLNIHMVMNGLDLEVNTNDFIVLDDGANSSETAWGFRVSNQQEITNYMNFNVILNRRFTPQVPREINATEMTYEHLEYTYLRLYNNQFDIPTLAYVNRETISPHIPVKCIQSTITGAGAHGVMDNGRIPNDTDPKHSYVLNTPQESHTFHFSNQLPVPVDTYLQWSNDNASLLSTQHVNKQIKSAIGVIGGLLMGILAIAAIPFTGGFSLAAGALAVGGVTSAIGSGVQAGAESTNIQATFNQARQKYGGNIVSGDGTDFAHLATYLKHPLILTNGGYIYGYNKQPYEIGRLSDEQVININNTLYWFGRKIRTYHPSLRLRDNEDNRVFHYFEFEENDTNLSQSVQKWLSSVNSTGYPVSVKEIIGYIVKFLAKGVRVWKN